MERGTPGADGMQANNFYIDQVENGQHANKGPEQLCCSEPAWLRSQAPANECESGADDAPAKARDSNGDGGTWDNRVRTGQHASAIDHAAGGANEGGIFIVDACQINGNAGYYQ